MNLLWAVIKTYTSRKLIWFMAIVYVVTMGLTLYWGGYGEDVYRRAGPSFTGSGTQEYDLANNYAKKPAEDFAAIDDLRLYNEADKKLLLDHLKDLRGVKHLMVFCEVSADEFEQICKHLPLESLSFYNYKVPHDRLLFALSLCPKLKYLMLLQLSVKPSNAEYDMPYPLPETLETFILNENLSHPENILIALSKLPQLKTLELKISYASPDKLLADDEIKLLQRMVSLKNLYLSVNHNQHTSDAGYWNTLARFKEIELQLPGVRVRPDNYNSSRVGNIVMVYLATLWLISMVLLQLSGQISTANRHLIPGYATPHIVVAFCILVFGWLAGFLLSYLALKCAFSSSIVAPLLPAIIVFGPIFLMELKRKNVILFSHLIVNFSVVGFAFYVILIAAFMVPVEFSWWADGMKPIVNFCVGAGAIVCGLIHFRSLLTVTRRLYEIGTQGITLNAFDFKAMMDWTNKTYARQYGENPAYKVRQLNNSFTEIIEGIRQGKTYSLTTLFQAEAQQVVLKPILVLFFCCSYVVSSILFSMLLGNSVPFTLGTMLNYLGASLMFVGLVMGFGLQLNRLESHRRHLMLEWMRPFEKSYWIQQMLLQVYRDLSYGLFYFVPGVVIFMISQTYFVEAGGGLLSNAKNVPLVIFFSAFWGVNLLVSIIALAYYLVSHRIHAILLVFLLCTSIGFIFGLLTLGMLITQVSASVFVMASVLFVISAALVSINYGLWVLVYRRWSRHVEVALLVKP